MTIRRNLSIGLVFAVAAVAQAQPNCLVTIETAGLDLWSTADHPGSLIMTQNGAYSWHAHGDWTTNLWTTHLDADMNADPFVTNSFTITNNTAATQTFIVNISLPVAVVSGPTQLFGSVSGSVADTNNAGGPPNWATMTAPAGDSIYVPVIDGLNFNPGRLLSDPFSVNATGPLFTVPFGGVNFNNNAGPGVLVSIGIRNAFTLTPGDSVTVQSTFNVTPSPGGFGLLAFAGIAASRRRRR
jgi:MYXO-CTERM domain-containing protein